MMEKKQQQQEKVEDRKVYSIWRDRTRENKEPKKKKGTLWKSRPMGGGFGKSSESRDITSIKNFLKKIVYKADITIF